MAVVVVVRDPRDVAVSLYHHSRALKAVSYRGSWDAFLDAFLAGSAPLPSAAPDARSRRAEADWFETSRE